MTTLLIILVTIAVMAADPIIFVIVLVLNFLLLNKKTILLYGILGGLIAEVISSSLNPGQDFGDKILLRIIAATIQSIIAYYIIKYFKNRKNTKKKILKKKY
jgi:hypothetical protein